MALGLHGPAPQECVGERGIFTQTLESVYRLTPELEKSGVRETAQGVCPYSSLLQNNLL